MPWELLATYLAPAGPALAVALVLATLLLALATARPATTAQGSAPVAQQTLAQRALASIFQRHRDPDADGRVRARAPGATAMPA